MPYFYIIPIFLCIIFLILFIVFKHKSDKLSLQKYQSLNDFTKAERERIERCTKDLRISERELQKNIYTLTAQYNELKENQQQNIDKDLNFYRASKITEIDNEMLTKRREAQEQLEQFLEKNSVEQANAYVELAQIKSDLEDFRKRRDVVNQQILREKAIQDEEDFYRVCVSDQDIEDLDLLKTIEPRFHNRQVLRRAAYDCYIKKPAQEMIKRVLGGRSPSGIYCITYRPTGELYIGRAVSVDKRWNEHIKNAMGVGTQIAHTSLHTKMAKDGIWNFSFQLLEEVDKDMLREREKFYIDLYGAKNLLNEKAGG